MKKLTTLLVISFISFPFLLFSEDLNTGPSIKDDPFIINKTIYIDALDQQDILLPPVFYTPPLPKLPLFDTPLPILKSPFIFQVKQKKDDPHKIELDESPFLPPPLPLKPLSFPQVSEVRKGHFMVKYESVEGLSSSFLIPLSATLNMGFLGRYSYKEDQPSYGYINLKYLQDRAIKTTLLLKAGLKKEEDLKGLGLIEGSLKKESLGTSLSFELYERQYRGNVNLEFHKLLKKGSVETFLQGKVISDSLQIEPELILNPSIAFMSYPSSLTFGLGLDSLISSEGKISFLPRLWLSLNSFESFDIFLKSLPYYSSPQVYLNFIAKKDLQGPVFFNEGYNRTLVGGRYKWAQNEVLLQGGLLWGDLLYLEKEILSLANTLRPFGQMDLFIKPFSLSFLIDSNLEKSWRSSLSILYPIPWGSFEIRPALRGGTRELFYDSYNYINSEDLWIIGVGVEVAQKESFLLTLYSDYNISEKRFEGSFLCNYSF